MYPVAFPWQHLPDFVLAAAVGIVCFSSLGLAVTVVVPAADAALPIAYGTLLPLSFISDVFFPADTSPPWLRSLGSALPLRPLARSLEAPFMPAGHGAGLHWAELAVMAGWTGVAVTVIARSFHWERPSRRHLFRRGPRADSLPSPVAKQRTNSAASRMP